MITLRPSRERGQADHGWLRSQHSFSFGSYHDPRHMGFGNLRVINEDRIDPGTGFATHGHRDMEIISVVLSGALAHRDSLGHGEVLRPGEVERMSAGRGIRHSEFNPDASAGTHFLQIWIEPDAADTDPSYQQRAFDPALRDGRLQLWVSPDGAEGSLSMGADARLWGATLQGAQRIVQPLDPGRCAYVHLVSGSLTVNGHTLHTGDAALVQGEAALTLSEGLNAELLLFDLKP